MRGPGLKVNHDVRRLWRCPACRAERRLGAREVSVRCQCQQPAPFMHLVESLRKVRVEQPPLPEYIDCEDLLGDDISVTPAPALETTISGEQASQPTELPTILEATLTLNQAEFPETESASSETDPNRPNSAVADLPRPGADDATV